LTFSERLREIRTGFERPFWIANISEIFERLSYYGAFASLALYLQEQLNFSTEQTGTLTGIFGGMVWFLAIFGGAQFICGIYSRSPRARHFAGETLRGRHHGSRLEGKCPLDRLLDLLHAGQHRRRGRSLLCFLGSSPSWGRECIPACGAQCLRHVLCGPAFFPGAA
jgi:hypothetical protein